MALALIAPWIAVATVVGCTPYLIVNAFVPSDDYTLSTAAYGGDPRQQLDIYRPRDLRGPAPVVVFFYGGSWQSGARAENRFVDEALASRGIVAVIADYRVFPQVRYPDFVRDSASAVAWTLRDIGQYGGEPGSGIRHGAQRGRVQRGDGGSGSAMAAGSGGAADSAGRLDRPCRSLRFPAHHGYRYQTGVRFPRDYVAGFVDATPAR